MRKFILILVMFTILFGSNIVKAQDITGDDFLWLPTNTNPPFQNFLTRNYGIQPLFGCTFDGDAYLSDPSMGQIATYNVQGGRFATVKWLKPGAVFLKQSHHSILDPWYYTTTTKVIWVVQSDLFGPSVLDMGLNVTSNCPSPATSISLSRTGNNRIFKEYFLDIVECTSTGGAVTNGAYWSKGWTTGNLYNLTLNSSNCGMNFQANKYYKIKLAIAPQNTGWVENTQVFQIKSGTAVPAFTIAQAGAPQITGNGVKDLYACSTNTMTLTNNTPATACGTAPTNVRLTCYHTVSNANGTCYTGVQIGTDTKTLPYQASYDLRAIFNSTNTTVNCNMNVVGHYIVTMEVQTAFGWSNAVSSPCLRVSTLNSESAEFQQCQRLPPTVITNANCRAVGVLPITRCSTSTCAVIAGPSSSGIKLPAIASTIDQIEVKVYRQGVIPPIGTAIYNVTGAAMQVLFKDMLIGDGIPPDYDYFKTNLTIAATRTYYVTVKAHNICGWSTDAQMKTGYFKITNACKDVYADFRTANTGNTDEVEDVLSTVSEGSLSVYPNPTTGTIALVSNNDYATARLDIIDVTGKIVLTPFVEQRVFAGNAIDVNITDMATGIYFYRLTAADAVLTGKIIKQ